MAKQIYIDENGNENLVSGTINSADMLPITSGSATNTKDYIDSSSPTLYSPSTAVADGDSVQIPANVLAHSIIMVAVRRYGYYGSMSIAKAAITSGACGAGCLLYAYTDTKTFKISETGLFTALTNFGSGGQWVDFIGIF